MHIYLKNIDRRQYTLYSRNCSMLPTATMSTSNITTTQDNISRGYIQLLVGMMLSSSLCKQSSGSNYFDAIQMDKDCLIVINEEMDFADATDFCRGIEGHLIDVDLETEQYLKNGTGTLNSIDIKDEYWIGLVFVSGLRRWIWPNGEEYSYKDRFSRDNIGNCVVLHTDDWHWENILCGRNRPFICKKRMPSKEVDDNECKTTNDTTLPTTTTVANVTAWTEWRNTSDVMTTAWESATNQTDAGRQGTTISSGYAQAASTDSCRQVFMLAVLSTLLTISLLVNLVLLIRCLIQRLLCSRRKKQKNLMLPLDDMLLATTGPRIQTDQQTSPRNAVTTTTQQGGDHGDSHDHNETVSQPPDANVYEDDVNSDSRSELIMIPNEVYNQDAVAYCTANSIKEEEPSQATIPEYSMPKNSKSNVDKDDTYDVPVSNARKVPLIRSVSDTVGLYDIESSDVRSLTNKDIQDGDIYFNEPEIPRQNVIPKTEVDNVILELDENEADEELYVNTQF